MKVDVMKREARRVKRETSRAQYKRDQEQFRKQVRCFWTWPIGHAYMMLEDTRYCCVSCEKPYS